jgi:hypothetical protein
MGTIADSKAARVERVLPQHQAALMLLQELVSDPKVQSVRWLDLGCGRGQILTGVNEQLASASRSKIDYSGYDISNENGREADKLASAAGFRSHEMKIGGLMDVGKLLDDRPFEFITFTNTVHEVDPRHLGIVLVDAVLRLAPSGKLFIYDMEAIRPPELGAIPWSAVEMTDVARQLVAAFEVPGYDPPVAHWKHTSCDAWSVQIHRDHLGGADKHLSTLRAGAEAATARAVTDLLKAKYRRCREALTNLTTYGPETAEEAATKETLLYEFWAVSRALEGVE